MKISNPRERNRLPKFNYSTPGWYYITTCTRKLKSMFGEIRNRQIQLNKYGKIVKGKWRWLEKKYPYVQLDEYVVMPNHFHGILIINPSSVGTGRDLSLPGKVKPLPELIGAFKTTSSKLIHSSGLPEFKWQRSFYDHIIRNEKSLNKIRKYIHNNPLKWKLNKNNPQVQHFEE